MVFTQKRTIFAVCYNCMARDIINRFVWIVDTLNRYGRLTRTQINDLWLRSPVSEGKPLPERTFHYYRRAIEENFHIDIGCNSLGEYFIEGSGSKRDKAFSNWLLDNYAVGTALKSSADTDGRVYVEEIPSAREFLPDVLEAIRNNEKTVFTYAGFSRSRPEPGIVFHPYFLKLYKQRWYMVGLREKSADIRTYALDRVKEMRLMSKNFTMPEDLDPSQFFDNIIGITLSKAPPRIVKIRATPQQAKYFRALPLHHSQQEEIHDSYSIFTYRLKLNYELVHELLGYGAGVTVLAPKELQVMVTDELRQSMRQYEELLAETI